MKFRQSRERDSLRGGRLLRPGEVDHEVDQSQLHPAPVPGWSEKSLVDCKDIYDRYVATKLGEFVPDKVFCDLDKWIFLEYAIRYRNARLMGDNRSDIQHLEPISLSDNIVDWNRPRYFAFASSTEAMFLAVLDQDRLRALDCPIRSSAVFPGTDDRIRPERFYFGIDYRALPYAPWRIGTVYFYDGNEVSADYERAPSVISVPPRPMARLRVVPLDWPLLRHVDGVDLVALSRRQWHSYMGYPWRGDNEIHPRRSLLSLAHVAYNRLRTRFAESNTLDEVAKEIGINSFVLLRAFQSEFGVSPHEMLHEFRIDHAKRRLRDGLPIGEVAIECGYCDQTHLNRHFRRRVAMTPGQYLRVQNHPILPGS